MARRGTPAPSAGAKVITAAIYSRRRRGNAIRVALLGFGLLVGGLFLNTPRTQTLALVCLVAGTILSWFGIALMDRWVAVPRADDALTVALADAGPLYALYNWALPAADHFLVTPWGLVVLHVYNTDGPVDIDGAVWRDRRPIWRRLLAFGRRAVRNPRPLVDADVTALRAAVTAADASFAAVPIDAVVVFTRPGMVLTTQAPAPSAIRSGDLRAWLREAQRGHAALAPGEARRLQGVITAMAQERLALGAGAKA